jgi:hypothetical protein
MREQLEIFGAGHGHVEIIRIGAELMQGKRLGLRVNPVDAVLRHDAVVVSDVKADDRMINAVARTYAPYNDLISARIAVIFNGL